MRKSSLCHVAFWIVIITLSGCVKHRLSVPVYPLDATAVQTALETAQLSWTIEGEQSWTDGQKAYTLHDEDGKIISNISSADDSGERRLMMGFMPSHYDGYDKMRSLSGEEWEAAIIFGTALYGGVEHERVVFNEFSNSYSADAVEAWSVEPSTDGTFSYDKLSEWTYVWEDITCRIRIGQMKEEASPPELLSIEFYGAEVKD